MVSYLPQDAVDEDAVITPSPPVTASQENHIQDNDGNSRETQNPDEHHENQYSHAGDKIDTEPLGLQSSDQAEHPKGAEIRRQVEFYFSDENLPGDAHLLGHCGGAENRPVSINRICSFKKMRRFKPRQAVIASLRKSTFLEVVDDKYIRRRVPLSIEPRAVPEKIFQQLPDDKPWITKAFLKPTGFEEFYAEAPVTPAIYEEERGLYDPDITFFSRIETAIQRYCARRKFHQTNAHIFDAFSQFGGIDSGQKQFGGGISKKDLEDKDAAEIAAITARHFVSEDVQKEDEAEVDFETLAKGFLSSYFPLHFDCSTHEAVNKCTNLSRNFYNYLLHHDVCPEYNHQINAARKSCDQADKELVIVDAAALLLPGDFNLACSTLHGGNYAGIYGGDQSWDGAEQLGFSDADANRIFMFGLAAYGTDEQLSYIEAIPTLTVVREEFVCLEVTAIEVPDFETRKFFDTERSRNTELSRPSGRLHCRRWSYELMPEYSRPSHADDDAERDYVFILETEILEHCFPGMKIKAKVHELDVGVQWLDSVQAVHPSFYTYLPNESPKKKRELGVMEGMEATEVGAERTEEAAPEMEEIERMVQITEWNGDRGGAGQVDDGDQPGTDGSAAG